MSEASTLTNKDKAGSDCLNVFFPLKDWIHFWGHNLGFVPFLVKVSEERYQSGVALDTFL